MNLALVRHGLDYRVGARDRAAARPDVGDLASRIVIVALFSSMAWRLAGDWMTTGHLTGLLLVASEALVVALTVLRRPAANVDRSWRARLLTGFATFGPPLVRPGGIVVAPEAATLLLTATGLSVVVLGKMSLGRSFGLTPANRGVVCSGLYRFVRHPIYLGYLFTHVGFALANASGWNLVVLAVSDVALMLRARCEERTLAADAAYRDYLQQVRWRILPRVY
jgi:protein-S-isoprenylcysteine O-methyltransferase Ste14